MIPMSPHQHIEIRVYPSPKFSKQMSLRNQPRRHMIKSSRRIQKQNYEIEWQCAGGAFGLSAWHNLLKKFQVSYRLHAQSKNSDFVCARWRWCRVYKDEIPAKCVSPASYIRLPRSRPLHISSLSRTPCSMPAFHESHQDQQNQTLPSIQHRCLRYANSILDMHEEVWLSIRHFLSVRDRWSKGYSEQIL